MALKISHLGRLRMCIHHMHHCHERLMRCTQWLHPWIAGTIPEAPQEGSASEPGCEVKRRSRHSRCHRAQQQQQQATCERAAQLADRQPVRNVCRRAATINICDSVHVCGRWSWWRRCQSGLFAPVSRGQGSALPPPSGSSSHNQSRCKPSCSASGPVAAMPNTIAAAAARTPARRDSKQVARS
jgi:hypothetical protein